MAILTCTGLIKSGSIATTLKQCESSISKNLTFTSAVSCLCVVGTTSDQGKAPACLETAIVVRVSKINSDSTIASRDQPLPRSATGPSVCCCDTKECSVRQCLLPLPTLAIRI